jgi:geranylgeranyl pyrophosphate synthase
MEGLDAEMERLRKGIETEAEAFLDLKIKDAEGVSPEVHEYVGMMKKHALAGKMMREIGMVLGYKAMGGKDEDAIVMASTALTMLQAYLLIHDDIMDSAETRRKSLSAWAELRESHKKSFRSGHQKFGESAAISQEFELARFRSIETRLPLIHCANTGISGVFDVVLFSSELARSGPVYEPLARVDLKAR